MLLVQKPDPIRNLNLSPFRLYVLVNNDLTPKREALQKLADKISTNNFKIELVDFDAKTQTESIIDGSEIDIHLHRFITMVHIVARVFPKDKTDFTFLPDTVDQFSDSERFEERLESKLKGVLGALIKFATDNIKALPEIGRIPKSMNVDEYLDSLDDKQRADFLLGLKDKLKFSSPEKSDKDLVSFLNYKYDKPYNLKEDGAFVPIDGDVDQSQIPATFKIVISKSDSKFKAKATHGLIDISIVADETGKRTPLRFNVKASKMTYLMTLLSYKYSFGLPTDLYHGKEGGKDIVASIWRLLYKYNPEEYIDISKVEKKEIKHKLKTDCSYINNESFRKSEYTELSKVQHYWLDVRLEILSECKKVRIRNIRLPKERIVISDDLIDEIEMCCKFFHTLDMYKPGYVRRDMQRHVIR